MAENTVTTGARYFDKEGNLAFGEGEQVKASDLKGLTKEGKSGYEPALTNEPLPGHAKKSGARTRAKSGSENRKSSTRRKSGSRRKTAARKSSAKTDKTQTLGKDQI